MHIKFGYFVEVVTTPLMLLILDHCISFNEQVYSIKVLVAIHYSVLDARNGYIRNVVV